MILIHIQRTKKKNEERIYQQIDGHGFHNITVRKAEVNEAEHDFGGRLPKNQGGTANTISLNHHLETVGEPHVYNYLEYEIESVDNSMKIFDISRRHHIYDKISEQMPEPAETTQTIYERTPNVDTAMLQLNCITEKKTKSVLTGGKETEMYEHTSDADVAQILVCTTTSLTTDAGEAPNGDVTQLTVSGSMTLASDEEVDEIYERAPNVHIIQMQRSQSDEEIYEQAPNVDITQILASANTVAT